MPQQSWLGFDRGSAMGFIEVAYELSGWRQWRITPSVEKWKPRIPARYAASPFHAVTNFRV